MDCNEKTEESCEPSDENCSEKESNDQPQTSAETNLTDKTAHNMNDLKSLDFNSADEVRQIMKAVLAGKGPSFEESAEDFIAADDGDHELQRNKLRLHLMSKLTGTDDLKLGDKDVTTTLRLAKNKTSKRRPGRPPKAGPSKKLKKQRVSSLYLGKLSNVVFLNRYRGGRR